MLMSVIKVPSMSTRSARLHILSNMFVAAHCAAINADVERMVFGNRALAQEIGGNRNVHPFSAIRTTKRAMR